jgi:hypothetical protein
MSNLTSQGLAWGKVVKEFIPVTASELSFEHWREPSKVGTIKVHDPHRDFIWLEHILLLFVQEQGRGLMIGTQ